MFLGELWTTLICWFSQVVPIRLVLLGTFFHLIGGGSVIIITMSHLIAAEHVTEEFRTSVFFLLKATFAVSVISEQIIGSTFMKYNLLWLPMLIGLGMLAIAAGLAIIIPNSSTRVGTERNCNDSMTPLLDEGLSGRERSISDPNSNGTVTGEYDGIWSRFKKSVSETKTGFILIFGNFHLWLLLLISFVSDLSEASMSVIYLLYTSKRFGWDFAHVSPTSCDDRYRPKA